LGRERGVDHVMAAAVAAEAVHDEQRDAPVPARAGGEVAAKAEAPAHRILEPGAPGNGGGRAAGAEDVARPGADRPEVSVEGHSRRYAYHAGGAGPNGVAEARGPGEDPRSCRTKPPR